VKRFNTDVATLLQRLTSSCQPDGLL